MTSSDLDNFWLSSANESFDGSFDIRIDEGNSIDSFDVLESPVANVCHNRSIPKPPPPPSKTFHNRKKGTAGSSLVAKETKEMWDTLFTEGHGADVHVITQDKSIIPAHYIVLSVASPVLRNLLQQSRIKNGIRYLKISGVPYDASRAFIRFLYSSCYEVEDMKKLALHLLVLSHTYSVPSLKKVCVPILEGSLNIETVIDLLQLARSCDAPRLAFTCTRMVLREFKSVSCSEGWKVMKRANPLLEQELLEAVVEADSRKQDRLKKIEERKVYLQLFEAMEALLHICRDGCRTIGPRDKTLKGSQVTCNFPACKGIESLVRHFYSCKTRVPGGCMQCKRMWQLLELHSRMCDESDLCKVPLCRHFKEKMVKQTKKDEAKWRLLVTRVIAAKNSLGPLPFSSRRHAQPCD